MTDHHQGTKREVREALPGFLRSLRGLRIVGLFVLLVSVVSAVGFAAGSLWLACRAIGAC